MAAKNSRPTVTLVAPRVESEKIYASMKKPTQCARRVCADFLRPAEGAQVRREGSRVSRKIERIRVVRVRLPEGRGYRAPGDSHDSRGREARIAADVVAEAAPDADTVRESSIR